MISNVEQYCRQAAKEWQVSKDAALAQLAALAPDHQHLIEGQSDMERWHIEQSVVMADGMIRWFLSDEGYEFVRSVTKT